MLMSRISSWHTGIVSVIDTATNTVVAMVAVENFPIGVAVTPDGRHAYVANDSSNNVAVIDTASNTVVATVPVGSAPLGSPSPRTGNTPMSRMRSRQRFGDRHGHKHGGGHDPVGTSRGVGIVPPPPGVPFLAFSAKLAIQFGSIPTRMPSDLGPTSSPRPRSIPLPSRSHSRSAPSPPRSRRAPSKSKRTGLSPSRG